ncbi:helicase HerA-like domain-containing protein [Rhizobium wenxiniae]|uniref:helicase HerA-like domain-containing protein n=1 Tax=Rhizobium wenxiniae TaxID=1737357 RepID=UPI003C17B65B
MTVLQLGPGAAIPHQYLTRHVGIFGATGTGKTTTLGAIAERCPCPVLILDAKGDLESLGSKPIAPRMRIDEMGAELIARALDLSPAQAGALSIALAWAEDSGRSVATLQDLRQLLNEAVRVDLSDRYGLMSPVSVSAVQRAMLALERGAPWVFQSGGPDPRDTKGIAVYAASHLTHMPGLYGAFVAYTLERLYRGLGELGDVPTPGLMVMIDEAHLLFDGAAPAIVQRIEQITRLIRSKGVGLIYVTQSPSDLPPHVSGQLATRVQHALRGSTPLHQKALKAAAETMPGSVTAADIAGLATGHALVSVPGRNGAPLPAKAVKVTRGRQALHSVGVELPAIPRPVEVRTESPSCETVATPTRWEQLRAAWYFWPAVIASGLYALALLT